MFISLTTHMSRLKTIQASSLNQGQNQNIIFDGLVDFEPMEIKNRYLKKLVFKNCVLNKLIISNLNCDQIIIENCTIKRQLEIDFSTVKHMKVLSNVATEINVGAGVDLGDLIMNHNSCPLNFKGQKSSFLKVSITSRDNNSERLNLNTSVFKRTFGA